MNFFENPFWKLDVTLRDDRHQIRELAEMKRFVLDESEISSTLHVLTHSRQRLAAEVAWLLGIGPRRAGELITLIDINPIQISFLSDMPPLTKVNLLVNGLKAFVDKDYELDYVCIIAEEWILSIAETADRIIIDDVRKQINEERKVANFPILQEQDLHLLESEIHNIRRFYSKTISDFLDSLPLNRQVEVLTIIVNHATNFGKKSASSLIYSLVDSFKIKVNEILKRKEGEIHEFLDRIEVLAEEGKSEDEILPVVNQLKLATKSWDEIAQPIQLCSQSTGLPDKDSERLGNDIREIATYLFDTHNMLDLASKITLMLREVFAEVDKVADEIEGDFRKFGKIAEARNIFVLSNQIISFCDKVLAMAEADPYRAKSEAEILDLFAIQMSSRLRDAGASEELVRDANDRIAQTLMQCAVIFGNAEKKWDECLAVLECALKYVHRQDLQKDIQKNLLIAKENSITLKDSTPIAHAPTLYTSNGIGFILYGKSDEESELGSYLSTYYFTIFFVPIFPVARYRVIRLGFGSYQFLGKSNLRAIDFLHIVFSSGLLLSTINFLINVFL